MQPVAASKRANRIVSGTPSATVVDVPKLDRMSLRTTPLWVRTSGPLDPSPGNGPGVSSGMTVQSSAAAPAADAPPAAADAPSADSEPLLLASPLDPVADLAGGLLLVEPVGAQATSPALRPPRPIALSMDRRVRSVSRAKARP